MAGLSAGSLRGNDSDVDSKWVISTFSSGLLAFGDISIQPKKGAVPGTIKVLRLDSTNLGKSNSKHYLSPSNNQVGFGI